MPKPLLQPMAISGDVRFFRRKPPDVTEPDAQTRNILVPFNRVLDQFHSEWSALMGFTRRLCNCASCTALLSRKNPSAVKEGSKNPISAASGVAYSRKGRAITLLNWTEVGPIPLDPRKEWPRLTFYRAGAFPLLLAS